MRKNRVSLELSKRYLDNSLFALYLDYLRERYRVQLSYEDDVKVIYDVSGDYHLWHDVVTLKKKAGV